MLFEALDQKIVAEASLSARIETETFFNTMSRYQLNNAPVSIDQLVNDLRMMPSEEVTLEQLLEITKSNCLKHLTDVHKTRLTNDVALRLLHKSAG